MTLTHEQVQELTAYFQPQEHEFLRGFAYITEGAITTRLDFVDPSWTFEILNTTVRGEQITVQGRLQVAGVWRDNVGMAKIMNSGSGETGEPEKSATTDALKRCARLFGIGRYLLDLPSSVKDTQSIANWLRSQTGEIPAQKPTNNAPAQPKHSTPAKTQKQAPTGELEPIPYIEPGSKEWWPALYKIITPSYDNPKHAVNSAQKMQREGVIDFNTMTVAQAVEAVHKHLLDMSAYAAAVYDELDNK